MSFRSKALLLTMFTAPESESARLAGVGTFVTSMREMLLSEAWLNEKVRESPVAFEVLATCAPSVETATMLGAKPRIDTEETVVPSS